MGGQRTSALTGTPWATPFGCWWLSSQQAAWGVGRRTWTWLSVCPLLPVAPKQGPEGRWLPVSPSPLCLLDRRLQPCWGLPLATGALCRQVPSGGCPSVAPWPWCLGQSRPRCSPACSSWEGQKQACASSLSPWWRVAFSLPSAARPTSVPVVCAGLRLQVQAAGLLPGERHGSLSSGEAGRGFFRVSFHEPMGDKTASQPWGRVLCCCPSA